MTSTGTYLFSPEVANIVDDAFERVRVDPETLTTRHLHSARYNLNLILANMQNIADFPWLVDRVMTTLTQGTYSFAVAANTVDILEMVLRRDNIDVSMARVGREDYLNVHQKDLQGRPHLFWLDRQVAAPVLYLWNSPENSTDQIIYNRLISNQDVGNPANTLNLPIRWHEAVTAMLAARLAEKYAPERETSFIAKANLALDTARMGDRDRSPMTINVDYGRRFR